jgi:hypothetical protein
MMHGRWATHREFDIVGACLWAAGKDGHAQGVPCLHRHPICILCLGLGETRPAVMRGQLCGCQGLRGQGAVRVDSCGHAL